MAHLSRRDFLKCAGVSLLAPVALQIPHLSPPPANSLIHGRALSTVPVYETPSNSAVVKSRLWPDTIVPIFDADPDWYRLENGYAKREALQPVLLKSEAAAMPALPFWAEVGGAVAVARQWCAADAPLVARIGHGGVAQVVDMLLGATVWYGLADEDAFIGWSQAAPWIPVSTLPPERAPMTLLIDTSAHQIEVVTGGEPALRASAALKADLPRGHFRVQDRRFSVKSGGESASAVYGAPWHLDFGAFSLSGAYWHNQFGKASAVPGPDVQVTPPVASWLFERIDDQTVVIVR